MRSGQPDKIDDLSFLRKVDWNLFRLFYEIARSGGISAAARQLNRRQPTISVGLKRLEDHLGVRLCRRTAQGIELTPAGRALLALCEDMMESARMAPHQTAKAAKLVEGTVAIWLISSVVSLEFNEALASFHRRHPNVEINLKVTPWRGVLKALVTGEAEIGIGYDSAPRGGLRYEPLFREVQQLYCSRWHPFYGRSENQPSQLTNEAYVLTGDDEPEDLERFRQRYGLGNKVSGRAEDLQEAKRLIEMGIGLGFLPTIVAEAGESERSEPKLWPVLAMDLVPSYDIYLITREQPARDTPTQLFLDELRRRMYARDTSGQGSGAK